MAARSLSQPPRIAGDDVAQGKPHPEAYLRAADLLGVDVTACVFIEDSPPGVAAGVAAGAAVVAVPCYLKLPSSAAYTTWPTLVRKNLAALPRVAAARAPWSRAHPIDSLEV